MTTTKKEQKQQKNIDKNHTKYVEKQRTIDAAYWQACEKWFNERVKLIQQLQTDTQNIAQK